MNRHMLFKGSIGLNYAFSHILCVSRRIKNRLVREEEKSLMVPVT